MKYPDKFKVAGITYTVEYADVIENDGTRNINGTCTLQSSSIKIANRISHERKKYTIIHELLHAMYYECDLLEHEEDTVVRISAIINQVLQDNNFSWLHCKDINNIKVKINGQIYVIKEVPYIDIKGYIDYNSILLIDDSEIQFVKDVFSIDRRNEFILYEILCAIYSSAGYESNDQLLKELSIMSKVLYQVLCDNDFSFLKEVK